jgi:mono/diheme cytochrome c family protein
MWWNPAESGWGLNVNHQGDVVFATLFTYDPSGAPMWVFATGRVQPDGRSYAGDLYRASGPAFNAQPFTPVTAADRTRVGTLSLAFLSPTSAKLTYTIGSAVVTKDVVPQVFGTAAASCDATTGSRSALTNYQDLWWNPSESGWGINIVHQDGTLFATLMTFDLAGRDLWLVMSAGMLQSDGAYVGDLYRATGPAFDARPFTPITPANLAKVGTMRLAFPDGNTGSLAYSVEGAFVSKSITRQVFASPVPACRSATQSTVQAADGPSLYATNCGACHGALATSSKGGATTARVQAAIAGNAGGMGYLSTLSVVQIDAIVAALASVAPGLPPACGSCHGIPPSSGDHLRHDTRFECSSCHGAGYSATSVNTATHNNGIRNLVSGAGWNAASGSCSNSCHGTASWSAAATLACGTCHGIPPKSGRHSKHDERPCSACHGAGYSSTTVRSATHNNGSKDVISSTGWNPTTRTCVNSCHGKESW